MKVIGRGKLHGFIKKHADAETPVVAWLAEATGATWATTAEIRSRFGRRVSFTKKGHTVFRLGGKKYRLVVVVALSSQTVSVKWIGTHAEYSSQRF